MRGLMVAWQLGRWLPCAWRVDLPAVSLTSSHSEPHLAQAESMLLGQSRGKEVRVMVHHSRNSEQKQWVESVVIALGGMARLLRAHLPAIVGMDRVAGGEPAWILNLGLLANVRGSAAALLRPTYAGMQTQLRNEPAQVCTQPHPCHTACATPVAAAAGWEEMMVVVESSMAGGRKEVALAAIALLSAVLAAHGSITDIVTPVMWKRAVRALGVGVEAATSPACMVPLMVSAWRFGTAAVE